LILFDDQNEDIGFLLRYLATRDVSTRFAAIACLGGYRAAEAVDALSAVVQDESETS
jgi:HEAT repeat protein